MRQFALFLFLHGKKRIPIPGRLHLPAEPTGNLYNINKNTNMKHIRLFLYALVFPLCLVSCGGSDDDGGGNGGGTSNNANANAVTTDKAVSRLEFPKVKGGDNLVIVHSTSAYGINYAVEWDCTKKSQRWSCYAMYAKNSVSNTKRYEPDKSKGELQYPFDPELDSRFYFNEDPFYGSGYDHGHICPSADRLCSREANIQTFYLTNMQPQLNGFNAGVWQNMETQLRTWNRNDFRDTLYVCKGGTIDATATCPDAILKTTNKGLLVPKYFFMAILCKNKEGYKALGFWIEHKTSNDTQLSQYVVNIDELESLTGIDFFCNLPDDIENKVESLNKENVARAWGLK